LEEKVKYFFIFNDILLHLPYIKIKPGKSHAQRIEFCWNDGMSGLGDGGDCGFA
jgi:hypothetical protein